MSSSIVLDASFITSMITAQPTTEIAQSLWSEWRAQEARFHAPSLLLLEVGTGLRKYVVGGLVSQERADTALLVFETLVQDIALAPLSALLSEAWEIASRYRLMNLYDASYVALADKLECDIWTVDARMRRAMPGHAQKIRVISPAA